MPDAKILTPQEIQTAAAPLIAQLAVYNAGSMRMRIDTEDGKHFLVVVARGVDAQNIATLLDALDESKDDEEEDG